MAPFSALRRRRGYGAMARAATRRTDSRDDPRDASRRSYQRRSRVGRPSAPDDLLEITPLESSLAHRTRGALHICPVRLQNVARPDTTITRRFPPAWRRGGRCGLARRLRRGHEQALHRGGRLRRLPDAGELVIAIHAGWRPRILHDETAVRIR